MNSEVDAVKQFYAAINHNDMQAITRDFDPQIVRIEPEDFPRAGTYRGVAEVQAHVATGRGTWAEGSCDTEKFLIGGDKVVVYLHAWVRLKDATEWTGGRFADGFVFRNGKIIEYRSFGERDQALRWAGIQNQEQLQLSTPAKNTICLWYDGGAEEAAQFYAKTFPDSSVGAVHPAPGDFPSGKKGQVLTVEFIVIGIPCIGLNGGSSIKHNEAFSFQIRDRGPGRNGSLLERDRR